MPPLSFTHLKYAFAVLPIVVKSTPGISMSIPPSLIGAPVAFLPVPLPQTAFVADAVPEPTGPAPTAQLVSTRASMPVSTHARPIFVLLDLIELLCLSRGSSWTGPGDGRRGEAAPRPLDQDLVKRTLLASSGRDP